MPEDNNKEYLVFFSHHDGDANIAEIFVKKFNAIKAVKEEDYAVFSSSHGDIKGGENWLASVFKALDRSLYVICLFTPFTEKGWILFEAGYATKIDSTKVIPLYLETKDYAAPLETTQGYKNTVEGITGLFMQIFDLEGSINELVSSSAEQFVEEVKDDINKRSVKEPLPINNRSAAIDNGGHLNINDELNEVRKRIQKLTASWVAGGKHIYDELKQSAQGLIDTYNTTNHMKIDILLYYAKLGKSKKKLYWFSEAMNGINASYGHDYLTIKASGDDKLDLINERWKDRKRHPPIFDLLYNTFRNDGYQLPHATQFCFYLEENPDPTPETTNVKVSKEWIKILAEAGNAINPIPDSNIANCPRIEESLLDSLTEYYGPSKSSYLTDIEGMLKNKLNDIIMDHFASATMMSLRELGDRRYVTALQNITCNQIETVMMLISKEKQTSDCIGYFSAVNELFANALKMPKPKTKASFMKSIVNELFANALKMPKPKTKASS